MASRRRLGGSWAAVGPRWLPKTPAGIAPGGLLGPSWRFLGRSCRVLGSSWRFLGASWASRDAPRRVPGRVSEAVWGDVFGALPRSLKNRRFHKLWVAFSVFFVKSFLEPLLSSLRLRRRGRKPLKTCFRMEGVSIFASRAFARASKQQRE